LVVTNLNTCNKKRTLLDVPIYKRTLLDAPIYKRLISILGSYRFLESNIQSRDIGLKIEITNIIPVFVGVTML